MIGQRAIRVKTRREQNGYARCTRGATAYNTRVKTRREQNGYARCVEPGPYPHGRHRRVRTGRSAWRASYCAARRSCWPTPAQLCLGHHIYLLQLRRRLGLQTTLSWIFEIAMFVTLQLRAPCCPRCAAWSFPLAAALPRPPQRPRRRRPTWQPRTGPEGRFTALDTLTRRSCAQKPSRSATASRTQWARMTATRCTNWPFRREHPAAHPVPDAIHCPIRDGSLLAAGSKAVCATAAVRGHPRWARMTSSSGARAGLGFGADGPAHHAQAPDWYGTGASLLLTSTFAIRMVSHPVRVPCWRARLWRT